MGFVGRAKDQRGQEEGSTSYFEITLKMIMIIQDFTSTLKSLHPKNAVQNCEADLQSRQKYLHLIEFATQTSDIVRVGRKISAFSQLLLNSISRFALEFLISTL